MAASVTKKRRFARLRRVNKGLVFAVVGVASVALVGWAATARGWDPSQPFVRASPEVNEAIAKLRAGDPEAAELLLERYLETGACSGDAGLHISSKVRTRPDGTFDLGLALFELGEKYGKSFGKEEGERGASEPGPPPSASAQPGTEPPAADSAVSEERKKAIDCALVVVLAIAADREVAPELRARAYYLAGNLEVLRGQYEEAVRHYDDALLLFPGIPETEKGDGIGRDIAHNRAIALRRLAAKEEEQQQDEQKNEDEKKDDEKKQDEKKDDEKKDGEPKDDEKKDSQDEQKDPKNPEDPADDKKQEPQDEPKDEPKEPSAADEPKPDDGDPDREKKAEAEPPDGEEDAPSESARKPSSRMLDELREAPTYQEENAKREALRGKRGQSMEDK